MGTRCSKCDATEHADTTPNADAVPPASAASRTAAPEAPHSGNRRRERLVLTDSRVSGSTVPAVQANVPQVSYKAMFKETMDRIRADRAMRHAAQRGAPLAAVQLMGIATCPQRRCTTNDHPNVACSHIAVPIATTLRKSPSRVSLKSLETRCEGRLDGTGNGCASVDNPLCVPARRSGPESLSETQLSPHSDSPNQNLEGTASSNGDDDLDDDVFVLHPPDADRPGGPDAFDHPQTVVKIACGVVHLNEQDHSQPVS